MARWIQQLSGTTSKLYIGLAHSIRTQMPRPGGHLLCKCIQQLIIVRPLLPVLLQAWIPLALKRAHDSLTGGHLGQMITYKKAQECFFWSGMHKSVAARCAGCSKCTAQKSPGTTPRSHLISQTAKFPFEKLALDIRSRGPSQLRKKEIGMYRSCRIASLNGSRLFL